MRCAAAKEVRTGERGPHLEKSVIEGGIQRWLPLFCDGRSSKPLAFLVITDALKKATFTGKWPPL
jgi:hypothetical protein